MLDNKYIPSTLIVCELRKDVFNTYKYLGFVNYALLLFDFAIWLGKVEGIYLNRLDVVIVYIFSQNDDGEDKQSKQLYTIHALMHELRHVWQTRNNFNGDEEKDADNFANRFVNEKSGKISKVMKWKDEWEVEEE